MFKLMLAYGIILSQYLPGKRESYIHSPATI